jgi:G3E family GTPase
MKLLDVYAMSFFCSLTAQRVYTNAFSFSATRWSISLTRSMTKPKIVASRLFAGLTSTNDKPIPMTLLSGFLGSGKTSALKHLLENTEGVKIGIIVNDVAAVNIDAKLVSSTNQGIIELKNGCACCSLADELLTSVQKLVHNRKDLDAVVVELSGVSDPIAIKSNWNAAKMSGHPATQLADVARIVTVVDSCTFGTDWMTWDLAGERRNWVEEGDDCAGQRKVPELLAEQVEAANLILINKVDLAGPEQVEVASSLAKSLNEDAAIFEVEFGRVSPKEIFGDHFFVEENRCADPLCTDASHSHSHEHSVHAREHAHDHSEACKDPTCDDPSHDHSHLQDHADDNHSHSHSHQTSTDQLGIMNFVYKAAIPFNPQRLLGLLNQWPVPIKDELDLSLLRDAQEQGYEIQGRLQRGSPFVGVLRSKGFCWFAPTKWSGANEDAWRHDTAMYWSHAGKHFGITAAGKWWATVTKEQMKKFFVDNMEEYERIRTEDFVSDEFGDRRQEIVFIGTNLNEADITDALNECLCNENELKTYRQKLRNYMDTLLTTSGASLFDVGGTDHMDVQQ